MLTRRIERRMGLLGLAKIGAYANACGAMPPKQVR